MFIRGLVGAVIGILCGAGAGAFTLGWDALAASFLTCEAGVGVKPGA